MKRRRKQQGKIESVSLPTAMIDIVMLILAYFIMTFDTVIPEVHAMSALPSGRSGSLVRLKLDVLPGDYRIGGASLTLDEIESTLRQLVSLDPDQPIMIRVHPDAREREYIGLLDRCEKAGLSQLSTVMLRLESTILQ